MAKLASVIVLALAMAAIASGPALAAPAPLQLTSISPAVADRGELVTISGGGFGARNLEVTVGGDPVEVVSATGSRATFRVPLGVVGNVEVVARNPGGITARIGLTVRFDGVATVLLDHAGRVSATIGRDGGTLAAGSVSLTIPAGALSEDTSIAMTPLRDLAHSPLEGLLIGGVRLEPEGLRFLYPATLTMPVPAGIAPADTLGFGSTGDGTGLHLVPRTVAGGAISLELWHFSTAGAAAGGSAAAAVMQTHQPSSAEQRALQRIAAGRQACEAELAQGVFAGPACANVVPESVRALFDWYVNAVRPGLEGAGSAPSFEAEEALADWLAWAAEVRSLFRNSAPPVCGTLQNECDQAHALATTAVGAHAQRRLNNCTGTSLPSQLRDVARMADFAGAGAIDLTTVGLPDATNGDLLRACAHLEIAITDFPAIAALFHANTLRGRVTVDVHSGPDRTDVSFELTVDGAVVATASDGSFQTTLTPTTPGLPLNVTLEAEATNPSLQNTSFTDVLTLSRQTRARLQLVAQGPTTISAGGTVPLLVRAAGDGMFGAAVTVGLTGNGSLSTSSVTTDASGEGGLVYTASGSCGSAVVTATLAPDLGSTSDTVSIATAAPVTGITISPTSATVSGNGTRQFSATVTGGCTQAVTWTATGGSISPSGLYAAGSGPGTFAVTASSIEDASKLATAAVTISAAPSCQDFSGTVTRNHTRAQASITGNVITISTNSEEHFSVTVMRRVCSNGPGTSLDISGVSGRTLAEYGFFDLDGNPIDEGSRECLYSDAPSDFGSSIAPGNLTFAVHEACTFSSNGVITAVTSEDTTYTIYGGRFVYDGSGQLLAVDFTIEPVNIDNSSENSIDIYFESQTGMLVPPTS